MSLPNVQPTRPFCQINYQKVDGELGEYPIQYMRNTTGRLCYQRHSCVSYVYRYVQKSTGSIVERFLSFVELLGFDAAQCLLVRELNPSQGNWQPNLNFFSEEKAIFSKGKDNFFKRKIYFFLQEKAIFLKEKAIFLKEKAFFLKKKAIFLKEKSSFF